MHPEIIGKCTTKIMDGDIDKKTDIIANEVSVMEELIKTIEISSLWSFQLLFWKKKNEIKNEKNKRKAYFWEELASWIVS